MSIRGIRGATTTVENSKDAILKETTHLLEVMLKKNSVNTEDIASIFFSTTRDLNAEFPAVAARAIGLSHTPLLCMNEIDVPGSLSKCIRLLIHVNTDTKQNEIQHCYLNDAIRLRPDVQN